MNVEEDIYHRSFEGTEIHASVAYFIYTYKVIIRPRQVKRPKSLFQSLALPVQLLQKFQVCRIFSSKIA